jgi:hypothetical protein
VQGRNRLLKLSEQENDQGPPYQPAEKRNRYRTHRESMQQTTLIACLVVLGAATIAGGVIALLPGTPEVSRAVAAGWVGAVLGFCGQALNEVLKGE